MYLKSWWYDLQFLRIRVWQIVSLLNPLLKTQKIRILKKCKNHNHMRYSFWGRVRQTDIFVLLCHCLHFYPPNNPENNNFEKMKKLYEDVTILYMCTKNHDHMLPEIWVQHTIFDSLGLFLPFYPTINPKN